MMFTDGIKREETVLKERKLSTKRGDEKELPLLADGFGYVRALVTA